MSKWKSFNLGEKNIADLIMGQSPPSSSYNKKRIGLPFFQGKKEFGKLYPTPEVWCDEPNKISQIGDILLSVRAPVGPTNLTNETCCIGRGLAAIRPNQKLLNTKFILYFFKNFEMEIASKGQGSTFQAISGKELRNLKIPLPSINEQLIIVDKLDSLSVKIDSSIILLEENLKYSKALISSALDEEFGNLEAKFKKKPLAEIVTVINGRAYKQTEMFDNGKYPILRVGNFFSNRGWYYSDMELDENKYCEKGDLLYALSASFGPKIWDGEKSIYHYHIWKLVPTSDNVSKKFMYYLLERDTDKIKEEGGRGVGMIHITKGDIEKRMMVLPPIDIQEAAVSRIEKIYELHERLTIELKLKLDNMKALKSSLLDQAFKGEL